MTRKILAWTLIVLSIASLILSAVGIVGALALNEPLTREGVARLDEVDSELRLGEDALGKAHDEIERALGILDSTEAAFNQFTEDDPQAFFADVQTTLNDELLPELATAQERLVTARDTLENVRVTVFGLNVLPFIKINIPDEMLTDLIDSADALEARITDVGDLAEQASVLLEDASQLFGGDLAGSRESLEGFLAAVDEYRTKVKTWRTQIADLKDSLPLWIDLASLFLTLFLLWFGLSQVSLLLHGRAILRGENPWEGLRGWRGR
ncbi:MAG: hypothetical protein IT314_04705 [Anaerolineales bacterium]|nr:hypothetical protein [Anaerolineales bacterium]